MNPLVQVIALLAALRTDIRERFNAALANAGPIEQVEAGNAAMGIIREVDWAADRIRRVGDELGSTMESAAKILEGFEKRGGESEEEFAARFVAALESKTREDALAAAIAEKKVVPIEDHTNALDAAREDEKTKVTDALNAEFDEKTEKAATLASRRAEVVEKVGEIAAAAITDEQLAEDGYTGRITSLEARIEKLAENNITPDMRGKAYADLVCRASDESFDSGLATILEAAGGKLVPLTADGKPKPPARSGAPTPSVPLAGSTGDKKRVVV